MMLNIQKVDHIGIRVSDKDRSIRFYASIGFELITDVGFADGHPVIMRHPSGEVINLLGPADEQPEANILMDVDAKHPGITHVSYKVESIAGAKETLEELAIPVTGEFQFKGLHAIFFRDPDRNVIELDSYAGDEPDTRAGDDGYQQHP